MNFTGYKRVRNFLSSEPGFSGLNGLPGLRTVYINPVEKPRVIEVFFGKRHEAERRAAKRIAACLNGSKTREFCNSRKIRSERGLRLFPGRAFFVYFLYTSKESNGRFKNIHI